MDLVLDPAGASLQLAALCANFSYRFPSSGSLLVPTFELPPSSVPLPSVNFGQLTSVALRASIGTSGVGFGVTCGFDLATGPSSCAQPAADAQCLASTVSADLTVPLTLDAISLDTTMAFTGTWVEVPPPRSNRDLPRQPSTDPRSAPGRDSPSA